MFRYTFNNKPDKISLGSYPEISLKQARDLANKFKELLASGKNPKLEKKREQDIKKDDFQSLALEWYDHKIDNWSNAHSRKVLANLERYVFPQLGTYPVIDIEATDILHVKKY